MQVHGHSIYDLPDVVNCLLHVFTAARLEAVFFVV